MRNRFAVLLTGTTGPTSTVASEVTLHSTPRFRFRTAFDAGRIVRSVVALAAAALVVTVHMGYLVYMIFGGFLALRRLTWLWPHIVSTVYSIYVTVTDFRCPLTALEKWLLARGGSVPYEGSFTAHYLRDSLYPAQYENAIWLSGMGIAVLSYGVVLTRRRLLAVL